MSGINEKLNESSFVCPGLFQSVTMKSLISGLKGVRVLKNLFLILSSL